MRSQAPVATWATPVPNPLNTTGFSTQQLHHDSALLSQLLMRVQRLEHVLENRSAALSLTERRLDQLKEDQRGLHEEHEALCDCLRTSGQLPPQEPEQRRLQRRTLHLLQEVFDVPELCVVVGLAAGVASARLMPAVSRRHGSGMRALLRSLVSRLPPSIHVFGGSTAQLQPLATAERYNPRDGQWEVLEPMSVARFCAASGVVGNRIYVVGGNSGTQVLSTVERFDPTSGTWEVLPPMPTARQRCAAAGVRGRLHVVGGERSRAVREHQRLNTVTLQWETLAPLGSERAGCAAASLLDKLYVVGGADSVGHASASSAVYNPDDDSWRDLPSMSQAREFSAAATVDGCLIVVGGRLSLWGTLSSVECFNPRSGGWMGFPPMPDERSRHGVAVSAGQIYVVGGTNSMDEACATPVSFDPGENRWYTLPPAPTQRVSCAVSAAWS